MNMIFGNAAWGFRETPLEKQLAVTRNMGLNVLELSIAGHDNDVLQPNPESVRIAEVIKLFGEYGVELLCASTGNDFTLPDSAANKENVVRVKAVIDSAVKLGIKYLRIFAGFSPAGDVAEERWLRQVNCLNEVIAYAAEHNITALIETHGGVESVSGGIRHFFSTTSSPEFLYLLMDELDPAAGILFDPANLGAVGLDEDQIIAIYRYLKNRIHAMHFKDFRKTGSGTLSPCACGEGQLDWTKLFAAIKGFTGPALIEYENTEDIEDGCRRSLDFLKKLENH